MKQDLEYEVFLNCILIEEGVRECFLFWCKKSYKVKDYINKIFPNLIINECLKFAEDKQLLNNDVVLVSKRIVNIDEYDTPKKLGKLLGYLGADEFENLDRDLIVYDYVFNVIIGNKKIYLFNEMCQNKICHKEIYNKINQAFKKNKLGNIVDKVILVERMVIPIVYLINKLEQKIPLTNDELCEIKNYLWNENLDNIYNTDLLSIDSYRNLIINFLQTFRNNGKTKICMSDKDVREIYNNYINIIN